MGEERILISFTELFLRCFSVRLFLLNSKKCKKEFDRVQVRAWIFFQHFSERCMNILDYFKKQPVHHRFAPIRSQESGPCLKLVAPNITHTSDRSSFEMNTTTKSSFVIKIAKTRVYWLTHIAQPSIVHLTKIPLKKARDAILLHMKTRMCSMCSMCVFFY